MTYTLRSSVTAEVDPISRIEGHLGVKVTTNADGYITDASAHGNLWRGFENFLLGRHVNDAITFTQRICGVCPVPHGMTATHAVDTVLGYSKGHITFANDGSYGVPAKAIHIRNLVQACDALMSSLTHQYHLAAPSYIQGPAIPPWTPYFNDADYHPLMVNSGLKAAPAKTIDGTFPDELWSAVIKSYVKALRIRRLVFEAGALFAGRMPMTSCYVGGGVTNYYENAELQDRCDKFTAIISEVGKFIVQEYVPIFLALGALYPGFDNKANADLLYSTVGAVNLRVATGVNLWTVANGMNIGAPTTVNTGIGAGLGRFLAWGGYPQVDGTDSLWSVGGVKYKAADTGKTSFTVANKAEVESKFLASSGAYSVRANLTESIASSRYADDLGEFDNGFEGAFPGDVSRTQPFRDKPGAYTYMKAPRWAGLACEVGPFARLAVAGAVPADGTTTYASTGLFNAYLKSTGLNPAMIHPDVAVGLLREGLATLETSVSGQITYTAVQTGAVTASAIAALYTHADTNIGGIINAWLRNLVSGLSTMDRLRARALESLLLVQAVLGAFTPGATFAGGSFAGNGWVKKLRDLATGDPAGTFWRDLSIPVGTTSGWGATEAPRGALMHQVTITNGKIDKYQCIVPTTWNGSPKVTTAAGTEHGAIEAAVIGAPFSAAAASYGASTNSVAGTRSGTAVGGVEVMRCAQSFDPCIACAIH